MIKTIIITLLIIIVAGGAYFWQSSESQKRLSYEQIKSVKVNAFGRENRQEVKDANWTEYQGKHFLMKYPDTATIQANDDKMTRGIVERFSFDTLDPRYTFSVSVTTKADVRTFDDISGVRLRRNRPEQYEEENMELDSNPVLHFSKKSGPAEETAYIITPEYVYSFSAVKSFPSEDFRAFFYEIFSSVQLLD